MPFPLLALPCGFQIRLRELCSNNEAFCIQIAAAGNKNHILPLTKIRSCSNVIAKANDNGEIKFREWLALNLTVKIELASNELLETTDNIIIANENFEITYEALSTVYNASEEGEIVGIKYNFEDPKWPKLQQSLYLNPLRELSVHHPWFRRGLPIELYKRRFQ